jgi:alpha-1,3-rhamnosyl/mannosyltransferase
MRATRAYLRLRPDFVSVVPNGVSERFKPVAPAQALLVASKYGLDRPYILNIGKVQPRKNIGRLLRAFAQLQPRLPDHVLALAGAQCVRKRVTCAVRLPSCI